MSDCVHETPHILSEYTNLEYTIPSVLCQYRMSFNMLAFSLSDYRKTILHNEELVDL